MRIGNQYTNPTKIEKHESPLLSFTNTGAQLLTWNHNLGFKLEEVEVFAVCLTDDLGYSAGEEIPLNTLVFGYTVASANNYGYTVSQDASNVFIQFGSTTATLFWHRKNTTIGNMNSPTAASWALQIRGKKTTIGDIPDITTVGLVPLEKKVVASGDADVQFDFAQYANEYESFEIDGWDILPVTDSVNLLIRTSADDGVSFDSGASDYSLQRFWGGGTAESLSDNSISSIPFYDSSVIGNAAGEEGSAHITIENPFDNNATFITLDALTYSTTTAPLRGFSRAKRVSLEQVTNMHILSSSGNLESGTFILYGKRKVA